MKSAKESRLARETMKTARTLLALMMALVVLSCTNEAEDIREMLLSVIEEIERVEQVNIDNLRELADNYNMLERSSTSLRINLEESTREKLDEYEELQRSGWIDDYRKKSEEGDIEELRELAGQLMTELSNLRGSIGLMKPMLESTRKRVAAEKNGKSQQGNQRWRTEGSRVRSSRMS